MNNTLYIVRNARVDLQLQKLVNSLNLVACYKDKDQCVMRNEKLIITQKKKYIFLRMFSDDSRSLSDIHHYLAGVQN